MNPPEKKGGAKHDTESDDAATNDAEESKSNDRQQREMIQKAVAFWNHPSLQDVPSSEKRLYLQEQQGLTNAQIHQVWEEIVGTTPLPDNSGSSSSSSNSNNNRPPPTAPQHYSDHPHQHHNHHPFSARPHTNPAFGQYFHEGQSPYGYNNEYPHNPFPKENHLDESISVARGLSLLGVGGALGVTGAAAVRWLNGGSFELFPNSNVKSASVVVPEETKNPQHATNGEQVGTEADPDNNNNNLEEEYDEQEKDEDYNDAEYYDNEEEEEFVDMEECLLERMDALLSSIDSNSVLQEKLILKLANTSTITDESMSLLKQNKSGTKSSTGMSVRNSKTLSQLKEVKEGLASLCNSVANDPANTKEDWQNEISNLLSKFDDCIQALEEPIESLDSEDAADTKSISTSETTQTEHQGKQDSLLPPAPATPAAGNESGISSSDMTATLMPLSLKDCIVKLIEKNNTSSLKSGSQLLYLYLANLSGKPDNRRYRKIFTSNESFRKVENLVGGRELLCAVGFVEDEGVLEWVPTGCTDEEISALILVKEAAAALGVLKKPDNTSPSELVRLALFKLSSSSFPPSPPSGKSENDNNDKQDPNEEIPQTPVGSSLLSPPMPKKMPFFPTPSDNLKS